MILFQNSPKRTRPITTLYPDPSLPFTDPGVLPTFEWGFSPSCCLRLRFNGYGRIFAWTNSVPGPPVYMGPSKFFYRLQQCLHGPCKFETSRGFKWLFHVSAMIGLSFLLSANHVAADGCGKSKMATSDKNSTWTDEEIC